MVVFRPSESEFCEEKGKFRLDSIACVEYLESQVESYGISKDSQLLNWIRTATPGDVIPAELEERVRYLVSELWDREDACSIFCEACGQEMVADDLVKKPWDQSVDEDGIRVGTAGYSLVCPRGHDLVSICTHIY